MKTKELKEIQKIIDTNKLIEDRINKLEELGYSVEKFPMGSGGVGQEKITRTGLIRKQISHGWGRYNYAYCVTV